MSIKRILVCSGAGEPYYTTSKSFIRALRRAGHDVKTCGPIYEGCSEKADINVEDKQFPETYSYEYVLNRCKEIDFRPEIIIQIEPHFYLIGDKPKDIESYYWILDPHRCGYKQRELAQTGSFDALFITQPYFSDAYFSMTNRVFFLPQAYDVDRVRVFDDVKEVCDIAYVGQTGIENIVFDKRDEDGYKYTNYVSHDFKLMSPKYGEYAERAHLLMRLCGDFNVRIYDRVVNDDYAKILQKGRIIFNRSLFRDITLRVFEGLACKRALVCDYIPYIEQILENLKHCVFYKQYGYRYDLENFELEYEHCARAVSCLIFDDNMRKQISEAGYEHVKKHHTFDARVENFFEYRKNMQGR